MSISLFTNDEAAYDHHDIDTPSMTMVTLINKDLNGENPRYLFLKFQRANYHTLEKYSVKIFKINFLEAWL